ncbi:copper chaperone PCu(A)C [Luteimonas sp. MC1782]|uniref:copper chaperone PCu(A)C n=1 Tax=Luteimonas sp. MC1782 TaxID=2760305 RepID=UPI001600D9C2|nr:copper chaperone PCu(A)C [Luteimonas sp. MC1782]MBB1472413.1 copper chaperone PCu(A)C [Luteimonas sp. MC1782]
MDKMLRSLPLALALLALAPSAAAQDAAAGCLPRVVDGWLRPPPVPMPMLAGFARIVNPCATAVQVVAASGAGFGRVEIHETTLADGVSRMRAVPSLAIAAGGEAVLEPGGLHLMLMRPVATPVAGQRAVLRFVLADGRTIEGAFEVRSPRAR